MIMTGIADKDILLFNSVVAMTKGRTWLDVLFVVYATADRVAFGDANTHDGDDFVRDS